jgi:Tfp pilus assembly protein PilE
MQDRKQVSLDRQRGMSLTGLVLGLIVIGLVAVLAIKVIPSWLEYRSIKDGIVRVKEGGGSVAEMQQAFDKFADINNVTSLRGRDLIISKDGGEPEISFAYQKRISLTDKASIVIDYDGTTDPSGVVAASAD